MAKNQSMALWVGIFAIIGVMAGAFLFAPQMASIFQPTEEEVAIPVVTGACGDDGKGLLQPDVYNMLNTTDERMAVTYTVFDPDGQFLGSSTSVVQALPTPGNTTYSFQCYKCGENYKILIESTSSNTGTFIQNAECEEWNIIPIDIMEFTTPVFKVYNNDLDGFVYASPHSQLNWSISGDCFYDTSAGTTEQAIGEGEFLDYDIWMKINTSSDATSTDKTFTVGVDIQQEDDWNLPLITAYGGITANELDACPGKFATDNEICYEFEKNGKPYVLSNNIFKHNIVVDSQSGVDPDDNINITYGAEGYYRSNIDRNNVEYGINEDDAGKTYVHTPQEICLMVQ